MIKRTRERSSVREIPRSSWQMESSWRGELLVTEQRNLPSREPQGAGIGQHAVQNWKHLRRGTIWPSKPEMSQIRQDQELQGLGWKTKGLVDSLYGLSGPGHPPQSDDRKTHLWRQLPVFSLASPSALNALPDQLLSDHQDVAETALSPSDGAKHLHFWAGRSWYPSLCLQRITIAPFSLFPVTFPQAPKAPGHPASLSHRCLSPLLSLKADLNFSLFSSLSCLVDQPSLYCKPWRLSIRVSCELGRQAWLGDTEADLQVQVPWVFSGPFSNSGLHKSYISWSSGFRAQARITENLLYKAVVGQNETSVTHTIGWEPK